MTPIYIDHRSILIVDRNGLIQRIYCPFRVICVESTLGLMATHWYWVDEVNYDKVELLIYVISGEHYSFRIFRFELTF